MDKRLEPVLRPAALIGSVAALRPSFVAIFLFANGDFERIIFCSWHL
jgi:hypothetical protein